MSDATRVESKQELQRVEPAEPEAISKASEILKPLLRDPKTANAAAQSVFAVVESHSGPIPHPAILAGIDTLVPGAAREIVDMAKAEQKHRHTKETLEVFFPYIGTSLGFIGLMACVAGCVFLSYNGNQEAAVALVAVPVVGAVGMLIKSRIQPPPSAAARPGNVRTGRRR